MPLLVLHSGGRRGLGGQKSNLECDAENCRMCGLCGEGPVPMCTHTHPTCKVSEYVS